MLITVNEIKELMDKMVETGLGQFELEEGEFHLKLTAPKKTAVIPAEAAVGSLELPVRETAAERTEPAVETYSAEAPVGQTMTSPIVGTFYSAPAPDKAPFAAVGQQVKKGDVLFIIESMKLMNEIQSEFDGTVTKILLNDGDPAEYGQPVMIIE